MWMPTTKKTMTSDSFYSTTPEPALRFGDIVQGCVGATPKISLVQAGEGKDDGQGRETKFEIEVQRPNYSVILTPCCEISGEFLLTAPLEPISNAKWLDNPFISEDFLRINEIMTREQAMPPAAWSQLPPDMRARAQNEPPGYAFKSYFIYPGRTSLCRVLPAYELKQTVVDFYAIDFRQTAVLKHDLKQVQKHVSGQKYMQMSPQARETLRLKLSDYYRKAPDEDRVLLAT